MKIYEFIAWSLDFEGQVSIGRHFYKEKGYYSPAVNIINTSKELLEDFKDRVGFGKVVLRKSEREEWKDVYYWDINQKEMRIHFPAIQPYLHLKWRQGQLVVEILNILIPMEITSKMSCIENNFQNGKEIYNYDQILILESCYQECRILNERGTGVR